jgi:hypothetical protein
MHDDGELTGPATRARLPPARLATLTAQAFNADHRVHRVSSALAASYKAGAHYRIAALADAAGVVGLTGAEPPRGEPERWWYR